MFHLVMTLCLAAAPTDCAEVLLPAADAPDLAGCEAGAARVARDWLATRPDLVATARACRSNEALPAADLWELAPGIHVHFGQVGQMEDVADGRIANLGVIVGQTVAVVDAGVSRAEGQALYVAIRRLTDRPISHLVLTHAHPDHIFGSSVFAEAGAEIVAHAALAQSLGARDETYLENLRRLYPPPVWIATEAVAPDRGIAAPEWLDLGDRRLRLTPEAAAHTDSDLTVFDEATGTLFAGDLVFRGLAPVVDGSLTGWLDWMAAPPRPLPRLIVPGHGPAATWAEAVGPQQEFLTLLAGAVRVEIAQGAPMSQAVENIAIALSHMEKDWVAFPETVRRNATAAYKELEWE